MSRLQTKRKFEELDSTAVEHHWGGPISFKPIAPVAVVEEAEVVVSTVDSKPFKCDKVGCGNAYVAKSALNRHVRIYHLGQKPPPVDSTPWKCKEVGCDKTYVQKRHLQQHMRINHLGQKPPPQPKNYKCTVCSHACETPAKLARHIRVHTKEKPYECTTCKAAFASPRHLPLHRLRHHADPASDEVRECKKKRNDTERLRRATDETFRLMKNIRCRVAYAFRVVGISKSCPTETLLGLPPEEVNIYLDKNVEEKAF